MFISVSGFVNNLFGRGMWRFNQLFSMGQLFKYLTTLLICLLSLCSMEFKGKIPGLGHFLVDWFLLIRNVFLLPFLPSFTTTKDGFFITVVIHFYGILFISIFVLSMFDWFISPLYGMISLCNLSMTCHGQGGDGVVHLKSCQFNIFFYYFLKKSSNDYF